MNLFKQKIQKHYDKQAEKRIFWEKKFNYFFTQIQKYFSFNVLPNSKVLEVGCGTGELLNAVKPSYGVGLDISPKMISIAKQRYPKLHFYCQDIDNLDLNDKFDYVFLSGLLGDLEDIQKSLHQLRKVSDNKTKFIFSYYNKLWEPLLKIAEIFKLKSPQLRQNWLSKNDLINLLKLCDYELIKHYNKIILPIKIPFLNFFFNNVIANLPLFRNFSLISFAHLKKIDFKKKDDLSVSIVIPARNEKGNIENVVKRIPKFTKNIEIIFSEGHSKDNTFEEIKKVKNKYANSNIKYFKQSGEGKGNAVREAFKLASGDILIILDADLTVQPEELPKFYRALIENKADFINGSRFVYPLEKDSMRFLNMLGNKFFSGLLSFAIDQKLTDTLCGTKAMFKEDYLKLEHNRIFFGNFDPFGDFDLIFGAAKLGIKIMDIPIRYQERVYGETQISRFYHGWLLIKMSFFALRKIKFI